MKRYASLLLLLLSSALSGQSTIDSGLVAFYPFCENATDYSEHGNHGVVNGGVTFTADFWGNPLSAAHFNGTNAFVRVPASMSLDTLTKRMTLACWFYTKSYDAKWASLVSKSVNTSALRQYSVIYDKDGLISFGHTLVANQLLDLNKWYHIAVTYQDTIAKCYLNGILIDSNTMANQINPTNFPLNIGSDPHLVTEYHHGMIDEVRIYNRALSAGEVYEISTTHFDCNSISTFAPINRHKIALYPNPTEDIFTIDAGGISDKWLLTIYDSMGKLWMTIASENYPGSINCRELPSGLYRVVLFEDYHIYSNILVKM